jgi:hypothetical protein
MARVGNVKKNDLSLIELIAGRGIGTMVGQLGGSD